MIRFLVLCLVVFSSAINASEVTLRDLVTDPRDGQSYPTVKIGALTWFAANLNFAAPGSFCYSDDQENCDSYGRLYRWENSLAVCPTGWHSSTDHEWQALELELGMGFDDLATINARGTNQGEQLAPGGSAGFNYMLAGYRDPAGKFESQDEGAAIWNANEADFATGWHRDLRPSRKGVWRSRVNKEYALSVRCVKNLFTEDRAAWD